MSRPVGDLQQRLTAIDPGRSCIVQAPAGSGKTELLTQRYLALLARVERPEEILAITFTRKAAAEMRHRLIEALERAALVSCPETPHGAQTWHLARAVLARDRELGWDLLENPSLLAIQTIDSFNAALVRRMPWLSRMGGMPRITESPGALYRRAAEATLARLGQDGRAGEGIACLLAHLDNRLDHLRDLLVGMLARRDQWLRHLVGGRGEEQRHHLERALRSLVEAELRGAAAIFPPHIRADLAELAPFAAANLVAEGKDGYLPRLAGLRGFPGATAEDLPSWKGMAELLLTGDGGLRKAVNRACGFPADKVEPCLGMKRRMLEVLEWLGKDERPAGTLARVRALPPVVYEAGQWQVLRALLDLLPLAVAELWLVFRDEGTADFAEIALKAQQALQADGEPTDLLLRLDTRIRHILVDEFQDTSQLQNTLLELLTSGWVRGDGRTLFLVGDPMQSIYRFREAEVGLFLQARRGGLGPLPLEPLRLSANFRSQAGIVEWVNRSFGRLFPAVEDPARGAVPMAPAEAVHPELPGTAVTVHPFAARDDLGEALRVTQIVREALAGDSEGTVAILVRSRTHLVQILPALRQAGLRYQAQDIDLLAERPAALDLASLTRAILHPADRLAWLSILRGPWCGLTLGDLYALAGGRSEVIPALLADAEAVGRLSPDGQSRAARVWSVMKDAMTRRGRIPLRPLVEGCWLALGGPVLLDAAGLEDAERVFDLLESLDFGGDLRDFRELDEGLSRLFAAPDAGADGRLQVMTIHKAKGLEFDTVIVPGLGRKPARSEQPLLRWLEAPEFGLLLGPIHPRDGVSRDPIYDAIGRVEREKEDLETTRLLYVAATRAKKRLHLLGHAPLDSKGECRPEAGSLLRTLWPVVENFFAGVESNPGERAEPPSTVLLRRLPADWGPPELLSVPLPVAAGILAPSALKTEFPEAVFTGWEAETARHVGTVTHFYLERFARPGEGWTPERLPALATPIRRILARHGVPAEELEGGAGKVLRALGNALAGTRGRWILAPRPVAGCELPLSGVLMGRVIHAVIDRTFIDADGVRWVIDYKTSEPQGESREDFLSSEAGRYRTQLLTYAELFRNLEPHHPVRAALYFPLFDGWKEIDVNSIDN